MMSKPARLALASFVATLVALALSVGIARRPLHALSRARFDHAVAESAASRSPAAHAMVDPRVAAVAPTRSDASAQLAALLVSRATRYGLLVEGQQPAATDRSLAVGVVSAEVTVSGPEGALLRFANESERDHPLVRFARWRIEAAGPSTRRLTGVAITPWEPSR